MRSSLPFDQSTRIDTRESKQVHLGDVAKSYMQAAVMPEVGAQPSFITTGYVPLPRQDDRRPAQLVSLIGGQALAADAPPPRSRCANITIRRRPRLKVEWFMVGRCLSVVNMLRTFDHVEKLGIHIQYGLFGGGNCGIPINSLLIGKALSIGAKLIRTHIQVALSTVTCRSQ